MESLAWQSQLSNCVRKRKLEDADTPEAVTKKLKSAAGEQRVATWRFGFQLDNAFRQGLHVDGLEPWVPHDPARPATDDLREGEEEPALLTSLCDEEGTQWALYRYMTGAPDVMAQRHQLNGPIHRRHNDWHGGLAHAGVLDTWVTMLFEINIGRGPVGSKQWHVEMESFACGVAMNMDGDHAVLLYCWPGICADNGWIHDYQTNRDARVRFLRELVADRCVRVIGGSSIQQVVVDLQRGSRWRQVSMDEVICLNRPLPEEGLDSGHRCTFPIEFSRRFAASSSSRPGYCEPSRRYTDLWFVLVKFGCRTEAQGQAESEATHLSSSEIQRQECDFLRVVGKSEQRSRVVSTYG